MYTYYDENNKVKKMVEIGIPEILYNIEQITKGIYEQQRRMYGIKGLEGFSWSSIDKNTSTVKDITDICLETMDDLTDILNIVQKAVQCKSVPDDIDTFREIKHIIESDIVRDIDGLKNKVKSIDKIIEDLRMKSNLISVETSIVEEQTVS